MFTGFVAGDCGMAIEGSSVIQKMFKRSSRCNSTEEARFQQERAEGSVETEKPLKAMAAQF
jgi:hypothetical protein